RWRAFAPGSASTARARSRTCAGGRTEERPQRPAICWQKCTRPGPGAAVRAETLATETRKPGGATAHGGRSVDEAGLHAPDGQAPHDHREGGEHRDVDDVGAHVDAQ